MEKFIIICVIIFVLAALFGGGQSDKTKTHKPSNPKAPRKQTPPPKTPCGYVCRGCGSSTTATAPPSYGCSCGQMAWQARY